MSSFVEIVSLVRRKKICKGFSLFSLFPIEKLLPNLTLPKNRSRSTWDQILNKL